MNGFDIDYNTEVLRNSMLNNIEYKANEVRNILNSKGYKHIIQEVYVSKYLESIKVILKEGYDIKGQNVLMVFVYGGQIIKKQEDKENEYIAIPPSQTLQKHLGLK